MKTLIQLQNKAILDIDAKLVHGVVDNLGNYTLRVKNGYLSDFTSKDGSVIPAVESSDFTHIEHWKNGVLHNDKEPAVIDLLEGYEEWWYNGVRVYK